LQSESPWYVRKPTGTGSVPSA